MKAGVPQDGKRRELEDALGKDSFPSTLTVTVMFLLTGVFGSETQESVFFGLTGVIFLNMRKFHTTKVYKTKEHYP